MWYGVCQGTFLWHWIKYSQNTVVIVFRYITYFKHNYIMWFSRIWQFFGSRLSIITKLSIARVSISTFLSVAKCYVSSTWFVEVIGFIYPSGQCYFHLDLLQRKMLIVESMRWYPLNIAFRNRTRCIRRQRRSIKKTSRAHHHHHLFALIFLYFFYTRTERSIQ